MSTEDFNGHVPPPKIVGQDNSMGSQSRMGPPPLAQVSSYGSLDPGMGLVTPFTPTSPTGSAPPSPSGDARPRKTNPLLDLIDTEKAYVERLTGIIRKAAAAWSRSNLPPPELDSMFRSIEAVFKANKSLLSKLKEIGPNPGSPKLLGDLLMRWIDDLETPYTNYCANYCSGFDSWGPVQSNARLPGVLATFSAASPPPLSSSSSDPLLWTLDTLFLLPKERLKYYKKLYSRLLKNTTPGRQDHRLLIGALDKLDSLFNTLEQREKIDVSVSLAPLPAPPIETEDEVVISPSARSATSPERSQDRLSQPATILSENSSTRGSERFSAETGSTSLSRGSTQTMTMPILDLERRLSTERTLDIFTMKLRTVKLQMAPASLTYTRELRFSVDAVVSLTPKGGGPEVVHRGGHLFLMSDLFLVCERMTPEERARGGPDGPDMWLCYPPLAGKVLRVAEVEGQDNVFHVIIMRKETLVVHTESRRARDFMLEQFRECIDFATSLPPPSSVPPPPVPSLPGGTPRSGSAPPVAVRPPRGSPFEQKPLAHQRTGGSPSTSPPPRTLSPESTLPLRSSPDGRFSPPRPPDKKALPSIDARFSQGSQGSSGPPYGMSPAAQVQQQQHTQWNTQNQQRSPERNPLPPLPGGSFGPGQVMPTRSASLAMSMQDPRALSGPSDPRGMLNDQPIARSSSYAADSYDPRGEDRQAMDPRAGPGYDSGPGRMGLPQGPAYNRQGPSPGPPGYGGQGPPGPGYGSQGPSPRTGYPNHGPGYASASRPTSDQSLRNAPSSRSLGAQYQQQQPYAPQPTMPPQNGGFGGPPQQGYRGPPPAQPQPRPALVMPSATIGNSRASSMHSGPDDEPSPPNSPVEETVHTGPVTSVISAQMKCKVFLKREHAQWKSLGSAKLKLYRQEPTNLKQLVVEADDKKKTVLISTIVLSDGVERVGKTGVAIELSDRGQRTGIVYMIQLRGEEPAGGLFDSLLAGSDRYLLK